MSLKCVANAQWLVLFVNTLPVATAALAICTSSIKSSKWKQVVCDQMGHEEGGAQPTLKQQPSSIKECFVLASPISGGKAPGRLLQGGPAGFCHSPPASVLLC